MSVRTSITSVASGLLLLTALAGCAAGGGGGGDGTTTLRYAFFAPAESFPGVQMEKWKTELEERTDGAVQVELYPGGTLLASGDIYDGVSSGTVEVGMDSPAYDTSRFPFSSVINNPVGAPDARTASAAFLELLLEHEPEEFADYEIVTAFTTEPAYVQSQSPVRTVDDLKGLELRSSAAIGGALERLGAAPVGMPMPDVAESLQTGVISGYASSREVLKDFGLAGQVDYVTDYPLGVSNSFVAVMDKEVFDSLPEDVQDTIVELREEMSVFAAEYHDTENVQGALEFAKGEGVETVPVADGDVAAWDKAMAEETRSWIQEHQDANFDAQAVVEELRTLVEKQGGE